MIETITALSLFLDPSSSAGVPPSYLPPARYDYPFPGTIYVLWQDPQNTLKWCPKYGIACTIETRSAQAIVVINERYTKRKFEILRHENGHCNGWTH